jgi:hypothetical protein
MISGKIDDAILKPFVGRRNLGELKTHTYRRTHTREIWLWIEYRKLSPYSQFTTSVLDIHVGPAPGGAYRHLGRAEIKQETLVMQLHHPKRVIFRKSIPDTVHMFALGDPDFFKIVGEFIEKAAFNEARAEEIAQKRYRNRYSRAI